VRWTQMDCGRGERREKDSGRGEWRDSGVRKSYLGAGLSPITGWDFRGGALSAVPKSTSERGSNAETLVLGMPLRFRYLRAHSRV